MRSLAFSPGIRLLNMIKNDLYKEHLLEEEPAPLYRGISRKRSGEVNAFVIVTPENRKCIFRV